MGRMYDPGYFLLSKRGGFWKFKWLICLFRGHKEEMTEICEVPTSHEALSALLGNVDKLEVPVFQRLSCKRCGTVWDKFYATKIITVKRDGKAISVSTERCVYGNVVHYEDKRFTVHA